MSNREIGALLKPPINESTVKNHLQAVFMKLGASDRAHAAALAIREGYITLGEPQLAPPEQLSPAEIATVRAMIRSWLEQKSP